MRRATLVVVLVAAAIATTLAQAPSFSSRIEAVRVDVLVTENGRLVPGLRPSDFDLLDNGVPQKVDLASFEEIPLNVVLALDMSASLDPVQQEHLRAAGKTLLSGLEKPDQAALVTFSHILSQGAPLTTDLARVRVALDEAVTAGQTSLIDACFMGMMIGESDVGRSLLIVFSDGDRKSTRLNSSHRT